MNPTPLPVSPITVYSEVQSTGPNVGPVFAACLLLVVASYLIPFLLAPIVDMYKGWVSKQRAARLEKALETARLEDELLENEKWRSRLLGRVDAEIEQKVEHEHVSHNQEVAA